MKFPDFKNKNVLILGLGLLGRGAKDAEFFAKEGAQVVVTDLKSKKQLKTSINYLKKYKNITYVLGEHRFQDIDTADIIIRNAAVPRESKYLAYAIKHKKWVEMDESLFALYAPCPIIGITGTRGKTTTTMLIKELLQQTGKRIYLAGNIMGQATLPLIKKVTKDDLVILELSSWQLQGFGWDKISPHISVFTNIYPDHMNSYKSMDEYIADKTLIFKNQTPHDYLIINRDDAITKRISRKAPSQVTYFSREDIPQSWKLTMRGEHNRENAAAAMHVAKLFKVPAKKIKETITTFKGVKYRLSKVKSVNGIEFINDTTSTTPIAGQVALASIKRPIVLLAGGASKNIDITDFAKDIAAKVKAVVLLEGTLTDTLEEEITRAGGSDKIAGRYNSFSAAINKAYTLADKGDVVLLSPGAASFGMFVNEYDRGDQFIEQVNKLS